MGETRKIVTEHYPVDELPEKLRQGLESGRKVRVTVEEESGEIIDATLRPLMSFLGAGKGCYTEEEAVSYIRMLRDES